MQTFVGIYRLCFVAVVLIAVLTAPTAGSVPGSMELALENPLLELYIDPTTAEIAVRQRATDSWWFSNPQGWPQLETRARGRAKDRVGSQFSITYFVPGDESRTLDSYNDSVLLDQYTIEVLDDRVRVDYLLGEAWPLNAYLPAIIDVESFEDILERLDSAADREFVKDQYTIVALEPLADHERISVHNVDKDQVFGDYRLVSPGQDLNEAQRRQLIEFALGRIASQRADYRDRSHVTDSEVSPWIDSPVAVVKDLSNWDREDLIEITRTVVNPEDLQAIHARMGLDTLDQNITVFRVVLEYQLDGDTLLVRVPMDELEYPNQAVDVRGRYTAAGGTVTLPLQTLDLLPFFGAAGVDAEGYILVPDGSGALIHLNNGKSDAPIYNHRVYGRDQSLGPDRRVLTFPQHSHLPIFGLVQGELGFMSVIEHGDAVSQIRAAVAGRTSSFNTVSPTFTVIPMTRVDLVAQTDTYDGQRARGIWLDAITEANVYQSRPMASDLEMRFLFFHGEDANYSAMAAAYRQHLFGQRSPLSHDESDIPLILDVTGAIHVNRPWLGIPRRVSEPLTSIEQIQAMTNGLLEHDISQIHLRYTGWLNGGVEHFYPNQVRVDPVLGRNQDMAALAASLRGLGIHFFPSVGFMYRYASQPWDGFAPRQDASRFMDRTVGLYHYRLKEPLQMLDTDYYFDIISPRVIPELVAQFLPGFLELGSSGMYLHDVGTAINSDFRRDSLVDRGQAQLVLQEQLRQLSGIAGLDIMVSGANAFVLPYAHTVVNVPATSSGFLISDQEVPFLHIVMSGYLHYALEPMNYTGNLRQRLLRSLETGALPYFSFISEPSLVLKDSDFGNLHASDYRHWWATMIDTYHELNQALRSVYGQPIIKHEILTSDVVRTTFAGGTSIMVNYSEAPVMVDGQHIEGFGYHIKEAVRYE